MTGKKLPTSNDIMELRHQAEKQLNGGARLAPVHGADDGLLRLQHELQVHQVELEMQNAELRQTRDDLETALEEFTDLYDYAPTGYFTLDSKGTITRTNFAGASLVGLERMHLIGRYFVHLVTSEARPTFSDFFGKLLTNTIQDVCELTLMKEGKSPISVRVEGVADISGEACRIALVDISERKRAEDEIVRLNTELEQRVRDRTSQLEFLSKELETFNYSVSHDLRAPLRRIMHYTEILQEDHSDEQSTEGLQIIERIRISVERMNGTIAALLKLAQTSQGIPIRQLVDLSAITSATAAELQHTQPERLVKFSIEEGISVQCDAPLIRIVMENLLRNAWKFTANCPSAHIKFGSILQADGRTAYFVRDNGAGFDMAYASKLFGVFQRLHSEKEYPGIGIGLATVQRIIRSHGGSVWAEGVVNQGATFFFTMGETPHSSESPPSITKNLRENQSADTHVE
jgi:PAS domain S-box-containing protein